MFNAPRPEARPDRYIYYPRRSDDQEGARQTIDISGLIWKNFQEDEVWRAIDRRLGYPFSSGIIIGGGAERYKGNFVTGKNAYLYVDSPDNTAYFAWYLDGLEVHEADAPWSRGWHKICAKIAGSATMIQYTFPEEKPNGDRGFNGNRSARKTIELLTTPKNLKAIDKEEVVLQWCNFCEVYGHEARNKNGEIICDRWFHEGGESYRCPWCGKPGHDERVCRSRGYKKRR